MRPGAAAPATNVLKKMEWLCPGASVPTLQIAISWALQALPGQSKPGTSEKVVIPPGSNILALTSSKSVGPVLLAVIV